MRKLFTILALGCSLCMVACSSGGKTVTRIDTTPVWWLKK